MSKELQKMLHELKNRGNTVLGEEVAAFLDATQDENPSTAIPYARKMLAQAAKTLREGKTREDISIAHDFLGASVEVFKEEQAGEEPNISEAVTAALGKELAPEHAFKRVEKASIEGDADFNTAPQAMVTTLANLLLDGGYVEEARRYLTEYNVKNEERNTTVATKSTAKTLKELQAQYRKNGDLVRARALEEVISDLDEECEDEEAKGKDFMSDEQDEAPVAEDKGCKAGEEECEDEAKGEEKPVLQVEPASDEESKEKEEAQAALAKGDIKKAKKHLSNATKMERMRLTAALIRLGDMELAMAGLVEAEGEEELLPAEEKSGGYPPPAEEPKQEDDEAKGEGEEDDKVGHEADEKPSEAEMEKRDDEAAEKQEADEKEVAQAIARHVRKSVRAGKMKEAKAGLKDLNNLEQAIVAGVKKAEEELKDEALAKEGFAVWKEVRAMNLKAIKLVAEEEGEDESAEKASDGLDALEDGATEDKPEVKDEGDLGDSLDSEPAADDEEEKPAEETDDEEADAMKYECLQSIDALKKMNIGRDALAFTFWESKEDPFWTIQAAGKPIAEVHLADQNDPEDVAAFFCDQTRWPNVIAQSTEKIGLYDMLRGVKARFYAHGVTKSALAATLKTEVEASMKHLRTERLGALRNDLVDSMVCAADALNKGLIAGKSNPLKRAFVDKLASLGFSNPALVVEECFAASFRPYLDQVIADAQEYLEMPKEAFAHTKRMIASASNVAVAQASLFSDETLAERLSRRSMPLAHSEEAHDAPAEIEASLRQMSASEKQNDLKRRLRLGSKF